MKLIYIGHANSPDFYTQRTESNIKGYSKTIEQNDLFYFDRKLGGGVFEVKALSKRDYNGVFESPDDAINAFFDADVRRLSADEIRELRKKLDHNLQFIS